jgi:L-ascorbate metabolism protein UlaG (beta-lactamase superfamily)
MKLTHLGHACLLVETDVRLLVDPGTMSDFAGLTGIDAVLVTHQHADHLDTARVAALLAANPGARLVVDPDSAAEVADLPGVEVVGPGDRLTFGRTPVQVHGGIHATVYGPVPGCTNNAYLIDEGAFFHPGDSFILPPGDVDVLAVAIDGPWLKIAEAIDYVRAAGPRVAVPMHEAETRDPGKYAGMLGAFTPDVTMVRQLTRGEATGL